ncbi:DNA-binding NarL/FixJ family response regulator [Lysobacter niabensis]|uniref:DNA-binding NarL/FixJ family response regulator n=1 Tax=Agrilutibacter niabensis TaxID=380628 RepID=A0ABU1VMX8_9GAMM|nr:response regulator transcription factor [Lysobacter niabensis]MDR7098836.1 DNA-binding NarL/FixJ family response regulator [Lysobacter niabensis]
MHAEHHLAVRSDAVAYSAPIVIEEFGVPAAITVMTASDRKALHARWLSMLGCGSGIEIAGEPVMDSTCLATCVERHHPRVLLLDKALADRLDPLSLRRIHQCRPQVRVLLASEQLYRSVVTEVLRKRFHGFLLTTSPPDLCLKAVRAVSKGELWLSRRLMAKVITDSTWPLEAGTPAGPERLHAMETLSRRELQVVERLHRGCSNKEIARELGIMEDTVKKHLKSVFAKLGVRRRSLVIIQAPVSA